MSDSTIDKLDSVFRRRVTRKGFLQTGAMTAAMLSGADLLVACGSSSAKSSATGKLTALSPSKSYANLGSLVLDGWGFEPDMVKRWTARFDQQNKENATFNVIPGDYPTVMETKLINKSHIDTAYVLDSDYPRWVQAGWIFDFGNWWDIDKAKAAMYPNVIEALTIKGKMWGLPYFTSVGGSIATNQKLLDKVGIMPKDYPKTWAELYDQMRHIKKMGAAQTPWLPRWINEYFGMPIAVYEEMANQGLELVNDKGHPVFSGKTEHVRVLEDEKRAWDEGLIPRSVLTMSETDQIDGFSTGHYAMSQQQIYDAIGTFNDPQRSQIAGYGRFIPVAQQPWGHLQLGAYVVPNYGQKGDQLARGFRLAGYAGYKDNNGDYYVAKQWAEIQTLGSGYKAVIDDPAVQATYKKWMPDYNTMMPQLKHAMNIAKPLKATREVWFTDWNTRARQVLPNVMLGSVAPAAALDQLRQYADKLVEKYHVA